MIDRSSGTSMRPETGNPTIHEASIYQQVVVFDDYKEGADPQEVLRNAAIVLEGQAAEWDLKPFRWSRFREGDLLLPASATDPPHPKLHAAPAAS